MRIGDLDRRIEILGVLASPVTDAYGQPVTTEFVQVSCWAQFLQQSAREFLAEGLTTREAVAVFRMRYLSGITTDHY